MQLPDPEILLAQITAKIHAEVVALGMANTALVGIHSGGVWLMKRIRASINQDIATGTLDAALYRDDFAQRGLKAQLRPPELTFDIQNKHIILIDDIFYTGRTTRAAMNELFDYGRPASIQLAVLINRGGAQLPIHPKIVGAQVTLTPTQSLQLSQDTKGKLHLSLEGQDV